MESNLSPLERIALALPDTVVEAHARMGRTLVRDKTYAATELAAQWAIGLLPLHAALLGIEFPEMTEPAPLLPSEILAAEGEVPPSATRKSRKKIVAPAVALVPIEAGIGESYCGVPGCGRPHLAYGFCTSHLNRVLRTGDPRVDTPIGTSRKVRDEVPTCSEPGCDNPVIIRHPTYTEYGVGGRCRKCYRQGQEAEQRARDNRREVTFL